MKDTNYLQMIEEAKMEAKTYGDAFVYVVPYKKAVDRLLRNKNNIRADLNMREQTIVSESNNIGIESLQDK
jgi:hypothetical protein